MDRPRRARTRCIETRLTRWNTWPKNTCFSGFGSGSGFRYTCLHYVIVYLFQPFLRFTPRGRLRWHLIISPCFTFAFCGSCKSVNRISFLWCNRWHPISSLHSDFLGNPQSQRSFKAICIYIYILILILDTCRMYLSYIKFTKQLLNLSQSLFYLVKYLKSHLPKINRFA